MKLVSIGIPFYNCEDYLAYAIKSVINQSYTNWELFLLDDGSTDNSLEIANSFRYDERIKVISDGLNKGLSFRLNQLISLSKGEYYARMDADDIMHFDRIKTQIDFLIKKTDIDVVGSNYYNIDFNNNIIGLTKVNPNPISSKDVLKNGCFAHPSIMGKTDWFRTNPYDEQWNRMEDIELWLRTVIKSNFANINRELLFYRSIGLPTIKKYINTNIGIIRMLNNSKNYNLYKKDAILYQFIYLFKMVVYLVFAIFGKTEILVKMRSKPIQDSKIKIIQNELLSSIK